jgi:hypothetical protein
MPKLAAIAALLVAAAFCCADASPASAQVMKNFSWKKKPKPHETQTEKPADAGKGPAPASKRQKVKSGS